MRHAHDELAHPAAAVPFAPFPRQPQHGNARLRLRGKRRRGDRERARRAQLPVDQFPFPVFRPIEVVRPVHARDGQQLPNGDAVEGAVLPYIEGRCVESIYRREPLDRRHFRHGDGLRARLVERIRQKLEIDLEFLRAAIAPFHRPRIARFRNPGQHQVDPLPPRFARVLAEYPLGPLAQHRRARRDAFVKSARRRLHRIRKAQAAGEPVQMLPKHRQRLCVQGFQSVAGGFGGHQRMAVAVAAHPAPERQSRFRRRLRPRKCPFPRPPETFRE